MIDFSRNPAIFVRSTEVTLAITARQSPNEQAKESNEFQRILAEWLLVEKGGQVERYREKSTLVINFYRDFDLDSEQTW